MPGIIFSLDKKDKAALATVRCSKGLMAAENDLFIWLKGIAEPVDIALQQLPVKNRYTADGQGNLFLPGGLTPIGVLPTLSWQTLASFIPVEAPVSALPGKTDKGIPIRLVPSTQTREGAALLTSLTAWKHYAETAPAIRLAPLRFAVSESNEVFITGHPLPPLPGREYWACGNILLPGGYDFELPLVKDFISEKHCPAADAIIVFDTYGHWQAIAYSCFVEAKRSAIRLTKGNHHD